MAGRTQMTVSLLLASALLVTLPAMATSGKPERATSAKVAVQTFHLTYRTAAEASDVAQAFLSQTGSVTVHPAQRTITVQDTPESVQRIAEILKILDQPQPNMRVEVRLVEASNDPTPKGVPERDAVDRGIRKMFHYKIYRTIGRAVLEWDAPGPMDVDLGKRYRLSTNASWQQQLGVAPAGSSSAPPLQAKDLRLAWKLGGPATVRGMLRSRRLVLEDLTLTRTVPPGDHPLLKTRAVLSPRQRIVIGASSSEDSDRALLLIVKALEPEKPDGRP